MTKIHIKIKFLQARPDCRKRFSYRIKPEIRLFSFIYWGIFIRNSCFFTTMAQRSQRYLKNKKYETQRAKGGILFRVAGPSKSEFYGSVAAMNPIGEKYVRQN